MNKFFKARIRINSESIIIVLGARIDPFIFAGSATPRLSKEISTLSNPRDAHGTKEAAGPLRGPESGRDAADLQRHVDVAIPDQLSGNGEAEFPTSVSADAEHESHGRRFWAQLDDTEHHHEANRAIVQHRQSGGG